MLRFSSRWGAWGPRRRPSARSGAPVSSLSARAGAASPARAAAPARPAPKSRAMALWLRSSGADFEDRFKALLALKREQSADVNDKVATIIARVREDGDAGLIDLTKSYDAVDLRIAGIRIAAAELAAARSLVDAK